MRLVGWMMCGAVLWSGCGNGADAEAGTGRRQFRESCYDVCRAHLDSESLGACTLLPLATCKGLCDAQDACLPELTALNRCTLTGSFVCGPFGAVSDAVCTDEEAARAACAEGGTAGGPSPAPACEGADESGSCPTINCDCPGGKDPIQGATTTDDRCVCLDAESCKELCL